MSRRTLDRLDALESQAATKGSDDPGDIYRVMVELEMEVPEPWSGEATKEWITRVPAASLEALLDWRDTYGQP